MISAWRRFINKDANSDQPNGNWVNGVPPGVQKLDKELQRKFARGVNYNMKVVIKGDAKVGKTSLFLRLKGYGFQEEYTPTEHLNVTSINWNYKATDDVVKIDLWEAIDTANKRKVNFVDLKLENGHSPAAQATETSNNNNPGGVPLTTPNGDRTSNDVTKVTLTNTILSMNGNTNNPIPESAKQSLAELSENFDVYKGSNAVILVMDMTKLWTFKYIQSELPKIPKEIPVLLVANHRDQGHHRTVSAEQVMAFIDGLDRSPCDAHVLYAESSMKNGFGLKLIDKFFNVPFLKLQESALVKQLEINRCGYVATLEELKILQESTSREYDQYLELETIKRRQQADAMSPVNSGLTNLDEATREQIRRTTMSSDRLDDNNRKSIESNYEKEQTDAQVLASKKFVNNRLPSIVMGAKCPLPQTNSIQISSSSSQQQQPQSQSNQNSKQPTTEAQEVENADNSDDSEDETPRANPLVAGYQSDLDSDDQVEDIKPKE